ncbi:uncharacterized protein M6B38_195150 [Iris pallida]|uniref:Cytochrome b n=1 Tax=Iris pallida TaxID=29817 RepID=A0AAX6EDQ1_IRIPA|nr:uncharacterized protein M6B38_195150 [Iris pallida]
MAIISVCLIICKTYTYGYPSIFSLGCQFPILYPWHSRFILTLGYHFYLGYSNP